MQVKKQQLELDMEQQTGSKLRKEYVMAAYCLSDRMDCSLPGYSIHGIFQARVLERGAIAFSVIQSYLQWKSKWI